MKRILRLLDILKQVYFRLTLRLKVRLLISLLLALLASGSEILSIYLVIPLLDSFLKPTKLATALSPEEIGSLSASTNSGPSLFLLLFFATAILGSGCLRIYSLYFNQATSAKVTSQLVIPSFSIAISQKWPFYLENQKTDLISLLTIQAFRIQIGLASLLQGVICALVSSILSIFIIARFPLIGLSLCVLIGATYAIIGRYVGFQVRYNSSKVSKLNQEQCEVVDDALSCIKDLIVLGNDVSFKKRFTRIDNDLRLTIAENNFLSNFPRHAIESLGIVAMLIVSFIFTSYRAKSSDDFISILAFIALSAQRLLPLVQQTFASASNFIANFEDLKGISSVLSLSSTSSRVLRPQTDSYQFSRLILDGIKFQYPVSDDSPGREFEYNLSISRGDRIAIVGTSGSGKSTLVDILLGLQIPSSGRFILDNVDSDFLPLNFLCNISAVPQSAHIINGSVCDNIALGLPKNLVDISRVEHCARVANIMDYIETLPKQFDTQISQVGSSLSGGQRQRISIARSLYSQASVLIFDEATSSLDPETESKIVDEILSLPKIYTVIFVTHRVDLISRFDHCIVLQPNL